MLGAYVPQLTTYTLPSGGRVRRFVRTASYLLPFGAMDEADALATFEHTTLGAGEVQAQGGGGVPFSVVFSQAHERGSKVLLKHVGVAPQVRNSPSVRNLPKGQLQGSLLKAYGRIARELVSHGYQGFGQPIALRFTKVRQSYDTGEMVGIAYNTQPEFGHFARLEVNRSRFVDVHLGHLFEGTHKSQ